MRYNRMEISYQYCFTLHSTYCHQHMSQQKLQINIGCLIKLQKMAHSFSLKWHNENFYGLKSHCIIAFHLTMIRFEFISNPKIV